VKTLFALILLLAAILPQPVGAQTFRVVIDPAYTQAEGNYGGQIVSQFVAELQYQASLAGLEVVVAGENFDQTAELQDRIHDSGRYDPGLTGGVPRGKMRPPTTIYHLTLVADITYSREGFIFCYDQVAVTISSILNPSGVSSGSFARGAKAYSKVKHKIWFQGASSREGELLQRAVADNVGQLVAQLAPAPAPTPIATPVAPPVVSPAVSGQITLIFPDGQTKLGRLEAGRVLCEGDPVRIGQKLYRVSAISGQTVALKNN